VKNIKYKIANFIDAFNLADKETRKELTKRFPFREIKNREVSAYIAAMVEELCFSNNLETPEWVFNKKYQLKEPCFLGGLESLKASLIVESPLSFRRRNIFVSENVLSRA